MQAHAGNATLVEFTLTEKDEGTRLRVVESGFTRLPIPADQQRASRERNSEGWGLILGDLRAYMERHLEWLSSKS